MNTIKFQRRAVATAVSAALAAGATGVAYAANISGTEDAFPKSQGELFLGAALTKIQINATGSNEALIEAKINYFDAADTSLGASVSEQDSDVGIPVDINIAVGAPAGVSYAVITVDLSHSADLVGTSQFAYVNNSGDMIGADVAAVILPPRPRPSLRPRPTPMVRSPLTPVTPASILSTPRSTRQATRLRSCTSPSTPIRSV